MPKCTKCQQEKTDSLFVTVKGCRVGMVCRVCRSAQIVEGRRNRTDVEARLAKRLALVTAKQAQCGKCGDVKPDSLFPQKDGKRHGSVCKDCTTALKKMWRGLSDAGVQARIRAEKRKERDEKKRRDIESRAIARIESLKPAGTTICALCSAKKANTEFLIVNGKRHGKRCLACATTATKAFREKRLLEVPDLHRAARSHESNMRRAVFAKRIPPWADKDAIAAIYAARPAGHHVDHIVPLFGKLVSGLHVECNLQYLTANENMKKNRSFSP